MISRRLFIDTALYHDGPDLCNQSNNTLLLVHKSVEYHWHLGYNLSSMNETNAKKRRIATWCLYILKCLDNTLYTGITTDLTRRVCEHNEGRASRYTRTRLPVTLIYQEPCSSHSSALRKEFSIKQLSRNEKEEYIRRSGMLDSRSSKRFGKHRAQGKQVGRKAHG